jgi:hypothetical protein
MDSIDSSQIPLLIGRGRRRRGWRVLKNTLHDGCFRAGGRGGGRLTGDWLAKWPDLATLMLIDVRLVASRCL